MATITDIRQGLADTITAYGLTAFARVPVSPISNAPAVVVRPSRGNPNAMGPGHASLSFELVCVASRADNLHGQDVLDAMLSLTGDRSVYAAVKSDRTLGVGVDASCGDWFDWGVSTFGDVDFFSAVVDCTVHTGA